MDIFEKLNKAFANWYESWFGDAVSDIRPKDVLRKIVGAMEDNRKEGLDNRIYVPNKYILEIAFESDEEKEYLLAFLDKEELESALRKYMGQNKYYVRGPLDFTIEEITPGEDEARPEKLKVKCKWDVRPMEKEVAAPVPAPAEAVPGQPYEPYEEEEYTVAATDVYDASTVAPPTLAIKHADGSTGQFLLNKPVITIGRSRRLNNDLVIEKDGMVSKRHAQISLGPDGFAIRDLNSTNGVWVNDERIPNAVLRSGDVIRLGATELVFEESGARPAPRPSSPVGAVSRPRLVIDRGAGSAEEFRLASEVIVGRALTSDLRFTEHSVSQRHARLFSPDGRDFYIEDLGSEAGTRVNDMPVLRGSPVKLHHGDRIRIGEVGLRFEVD